MAPTSSPGGALPPRRGGGGLAREPSLGGGTQVILNETGSWADLADPASIATADGKSELKARPKGMLGFLARQRGRAVSPKPQERGVLGKEGARHIIG